MSVVTKEAAGVWRPIVDRPERCHGCQTCMLGCSLLHESECYPQLARLRVHKDMARLAYEIRICRHCYEPECLAACAVGAMSLDSRGVVLLDDDICNRCGSCAEACPYDAIFYNEREDRYLKCELCAGRTDGPLCVVLCPTATLVAPRRLRGGEV